MAPTVLPDDAQFTVRGGGGPVAYESAWLACRMLADRYGEARLVRFYRAARAEGTPAALRSQFGLSVAQLTTQWRGYVRRVLSDEPGTRGATVPPGA